MRTMKLALLKVDTYIFVYTAYCLREGRRGKSNI